MASDLPKRAQDAAYVLVGFGVLALQRVQVRRREIQKALEANAKRLFESGA